MQNRKPTQLNVVSDDPTGNTWALPNGAIVRFGKGDLGGVKLSLDNTYFAVGTGSGLWWYDVPSMIPISLWETEKGLINSIVFSPEGKWIVTNNWSGTLKVLDIQTGKCVYKMEDQWAWDGIAFSPNGGRIAIAGEDIKVLDMQRGVCIAQMVEETHEDVSSHIDQLTFSPNGQYVAAEVINSEVYSDDGELLNPGAAGNQIYIWDSGTGTQLAKFPSERFAFSPDSRLVAYAAPDDNDPDSVDCCVSVWDIAAKERIAHFIGHSDYINDIIFSPCGKFIVSSRKTLRVWDLATGKQKSVFSMSTDDEIEFVRPRPVYSPEGVLHAEVTNYDKRLIEVWDIESNKKLQILEWPHGIGSECFALCPDLVIIYALSSDCTDGKTHTFPALREPRFPWPEAMAVWLDDQTLASRSIRQGIVLWDIPQKRVRETLMDDKNFDYFTISIHGSILAMEIGDTIKIWDAGVSRKPIVEFTIPPEELILHRGRFAPTGDQFATANRNGAFYVWHFESPEYPTKFAGHTDRVDSLVFSPDGKQLVSGSSDKTVRLWDVEACGEIAILPMDEPRIPMGVTFSPCGNLIAGGMDNKIRLWCAKQLTILHTIPQSENNMRTYALAFSPCGKYLASGTWWQPGMEKMAIRIWDVATGENIHTFWGHNSDVQSLAFSPNGTMLASSGFDGTILVWDLKPYL